MPSSARAVGATAPTSVTDGDPVTDRAAPASSYTDTGLTSSTTYSYAVFAHDATPNYAAAATLTVTTSAVPTQAVLAINPLTSGGTKVTLDAVVAFDATGSVAADGTTLASATLNYGDGQQEAFSIGSTGPVGDWNSTHTYASTGTKTVTLTVVAVDGTQDVSTVPIHVFDGPTATLEKTDQSGGRVSLAMTGDTPGGTQFTHYQLQFSGAENFQPEGSTAPPTSLQVTDLLPGDYVVTLRVENDADGSFTTSEVSFHIN